MEDSLKKELKRSIAIAGIELAVFCFALTQLQNDLGVAIICVIELFGAIATGNTNPRSHVKTKAERVVELSLIGILIIVGFGAGWMTLTSPTFITKALYATIVGRILATVYNLTLRSLTSYREQI